MVNMLIVGKQGREILIQTGKEFYKLDFAFKIKDTKALQPILNKYDVRVLPENEYIK